MKVLVLTTEPVDAQMVRAALGDDAEDAEDAEVMVVSPALSQSPMRFWTSDTDRATARAHDVQDETVDRLDAEGIEAAPPAGAGDADPIQALEDALATFPADRVLVFSRPDGEPAYREDELAEAEERLGVPVVRAQVGG